jgi:hypothetical protein
MYQKLSKKNIFIKINLFDYLNIYKKISKRTKEILIYIISLLTLLLYFTTKLADKISYYYFFPKNSNQTVAFLSFDKAQEFKLKFAIKLQIRQKEENMVI